MEWEKYRKYCHVVSIICIIVLTFSFFDIISDSDRLQDWLEVAAICGVSLFGMSLMVNATKGQKLVQFKKANLVLKFLFVCTVVMLGKFSITESPFKVPVSLLLLVKSIIEGYFILLEERKLKKKVFGFFGDDSDDEDEGEDKAERRTGDEEEMQGIQNDDETKADEESEF